MRLTIALGGHPPPLVRRHHDGSVRAVGCPGTALGMLPGVDVSEVVVDLAAGDVLLAYTDGITEARTGEEQFGEERLAEVLAAVRNDPGTTWPAPGWRHEHLVDERDPWAGNPDRSTTADAPPHPATRLAEEVADSVLAAVRAFAPERDDVALLVLAAT